MKNIFLNLLRVIGLLVGALLGGIPFLIGLINGLLIRPPWFAYAFNFLVTLAVTYLLWSRPEILPFWKIHLPEHDVTTIQHYSNLLARIAWNLSLSLLGVMTALAAKNGYHEARMRNEGERSPS